MIPGLAPLRAMSYPGRFIIVGRDKSGEQSIVAYGITGRSPASRARRLELDRDKIWTKPTDEEALRKGNPDLLIYPAIIFSRGIAVSNGRQTTSIHEQMVRSAEPGEILHLALLNWDFEPDPPIYTPRIGGCLLSPFKAALGIVRRGENGDTKRMVFDFPLIPGRGKLISTYSGEDRSRIRPFASYPPELSLAQSTARGLAEAVHESLEPKPPEEDLRVAVACVFSSDLGPETSDVFIINRELRKADSHGQS